MSLLRAAANLLRRDRLERDLDEELNAALEELAAERRAAGASEEEARRAAARELGALGELKEEIRETRSGFRAETLLRDAAFAVRSLRKAPAFTVVAVLTLTLGIGGTAAMFSAVQAARGPLPYPEHRRLVHLWAYWPGGFGNMSYRDFEAIAAESRSFEALSAYETWGGVAMSGSGDPVRLASSFATRDYFPLLGARAEVGRLFTAEENGAREGPSVAVLSHAVWQRHFGGQAVVNTRILLNGMPFTVIGVMGAGFRDLGLGENGPETGVWLPMALAPRVLSQPAMADVMQIYWGLGRLRRGVSVEAARAELRGIARRQARRFPDSNRSTGFDARPLEDWMKGALTRPSLLALAAAGLILLLACTNLALNLLVRVGRRRGEMALRAALGASSSRLFQQLLVEAGLLSIAGTLLGVGLAAAIIHPLGAWVRTNVAGIAEMRFDVWVVGAAALLAVAATAVFGVIPALDGRRVDIRSMLARDAGRTASGAFRAGTGLVVAQVALVMALLVGAALTVASFHRLLAGDLGFRTERLLTFQTTLSAARAATPAARVRFALLAEEALRGAPGVESVTLLGPSALGNATWVTNVYREGRVTDVALMAFRHSVNAGGLSHIGVPLLAGRDVGPMDVDAAPRVAVVSASVAKQLWPGGDAVGKRFSRQEAPQAVITVVGVAADAQQRNRYSLDDIAVGLGPVGIGPQRDIYFPYAQAPPTALTWAVRTRGDPMAALPDVRTALARLDPDMPIADPTAFEDRLALQRSAPAAFAWLFGGFAAFGLLLAGLGVFGVVSQVVAARRKEIGIRLALGALPGRLVARLVAGGVSVALAGTLVGLAAAAALARVVSSLLFGVSASDARVYAGMAALLLLTTCASALAPALAAVRRNPLAALRQE